MKSGLTLQNRQQNIWSSDIICFGTSMFEGLVNYAKNHAPAQSVHKRYNPSSNMFKPIQVV